MLTLAKESGIYLDSINNNSQEKIEIIKNALEKNNLPRNEDYEFKIVEVGVGGGGPLRELARSCASRNDVKIFGVDVVPSIVDSLSDLPNVKGIMAEANNLPLKANSISAINASAVLHEVSSYGVNHDRGPKFGIPAVKETLAEFKRVLLLGGMVACRDVLACDSDPYVLKTVRYYPYSWRMFAEFFLKDFIQSQPFLYQNSRLEDRIFDDAYVLEAPIGLHRELQRHYLMFRDYIRTVQAEEFGIKIRKTYWLDQSKGLKFMTFSVKRKYASKVNLEHFEKKLSVSGIVYKGTSEYVDQLYDELVQYKFEQIAQGVEDGLKFADLIKNWKEREGHECYTYGNFGEMLLMLSEMKDDGLVLFPEKSDDLEISPRDYYNAYLKRVIDRPEFDGKQIITLRKMSVAEARNSALKLKDSSFIKLSILEKIIQNLT
jgi:ubiquinone/menaquinone biosynthesis C-methylase UbiE